MMVGWAGRLDVVQRPSRYRPRERRSIGSESRDTPGLPGGSYRSGKTGDDEPCEPKGAVVAAGCLFKDVARHGYIDFQETVDNVTLNRHTERID